MAIIITPALVITPVDALPASFPKVGWDNKVTFSNLSADSAEADFPVTNLANPDTGLKWVSASTAEQVITITGIEGQSDYVGIARHNFGSTGALVSIEGVTAETAPSFVEVFEGVLVADDRPLMLQFARDYYTSLRLRIVPDGTAPSAAVLYAGELLTLMRGLQPGYTPLADAESVDMVNGRSERGEYLGAIITGGELQASVQIKVLDPDWYRETMAPFVRAANRGLPFFFAWNPEEYPDDVGFCWFGGDVRPVYAVLSRQMDISLPLRGLAL